MNTLTELVTTWAELLAVSLRVTSSYRSSRSAIFMANSLEEVI
jgi:hypothetical protein